MLDERIQAIHRVCFDLEPSESDLAALGDTKRWLIYRALVRKRLVGVVEAAIPRTRTAVGTELFGSSVREWMATGGPKTRFFRHVPEELVNFAIPIWRRACPPWVSNLALYEIGSWAVRHAPADPVDVEELTFEKRPVVGTAVRIVRLDYPVHRARAASEECEIEPTILCLYRDGEHRTASLTLNAIAADLLQAWQRAEQTLADSVQSVAKAHRIEIGPDFVDKLSTLLSDFLTRGVLLGGRRDPQ